MQWILMLADIMYAFYTLLQNDYIKRRKLAQSLQWFDIKILKNVVNYQIIYFLIITLYFQRQIGTFIMAFISLVGIWAFLKVKQKSSYTVYGFQASAHLCTGLCTDLVMELMDMC
ncbi:hypothetical protein ACJX0J_007063, partial [Zea mays]